LKLIPRLDFDSAVCKHGGERNARGFTCWGQFVAMLFSQLGSVNSLRDVTNGLAASEGKLRHLAWKTMKLLSLPSHISTATTTTVMNRLPKKPAV
jgi:hypothetical protein